MGISDSKKKHLVSIKIAILLSKTHINIANANTSGLKKVEQQTSKEYILNIRGMIREKAYYITQEIKWKL